MPHFAGEQPKVERKHFTGGPVAVLEHRRFESALLQKVEQAQVVEHVECRRVEGRGTQVFGRLRKRLYQGHRHAATRQAEGADQADRPGAGNQYFFACFHGFYDSRRSALHSATILNGLSRT